MAAWYISQPRWMDGKFNVAVAEFRQIGETDNPSIGQDASQILFESLDYEYRLAGLDVQVAHTNIGEIRDSDEAERLAQQINADVVIYGTVSVTGDDVQIAPKFYVTDAALIDISELIGLHNLAAPIKFSKQEIFDLQGSRSDELQQRATIVIEFTKCIAYLASHDENLIDDALEAIQRAIDSASDQEFKGKEVLFLFASASAKLAGDLDAAQDYINQAFVINPTYGRAFIVQGNIYYMRGVGHYREDDLVTSQEEFATALAFYSEALQPENNYPSNAYISEKAHVGLGNVYTFQYQIANSVEKADFAQNAISHYQFVTESYLSERDDHLRELAAAAYYGLSVIYQGENEHCAALMVLEQALALTERSDVETRAQNRLDQVQPMAGDCQPDSLAGS